MQGLQAPNAVIGSGQVRTSLYQTWVDRAEKLVFLVKVMRTALLVLLAYWLLIFVGTHLPSHSIPALGKGDKAIHFAAFGGLAFLLAWAIPSGRRPLSYNIAIAAAIAFVYAVVDELTQLMVPGRSGDVWDVVADSVGIVLGLVAYLIARQAISRIGWARRLLQPRDA
jgi:VanZ family protein